jgi:hypothetical protein
LLRQEDEVPDYSASGTDFLLVDCFGGTTAAEGTAFGTTAETDAGSAVDIPKGDSLEPMGWIT